jgi:ubiquinone/menaquinone biosynthesis C-methylase UbiE
VGNEFHKYLDHARMEEVYARQAKRADLVDTWLDALELAPGRPVVDVGSGPGYVSLAAARRVGPAGMVYAIDRWTEALAYLERLQREQGIAQIRRIVADAAALDADTIEGDAALVTMMLHHADDPRAVLRTVARHIPPGGRVVIAEFHPDGPGTVGPPREHRLAPDVIAEWCRAAGFRRLDERRQTPEHYLFVLVRTDND